MARLPWAKGNLLIAFTPNDIIKELGLCVRPVPVSLSLSLALSLRHTVGKVKREKIRKETIELRWMMRAGGMGLEENEAKSKEVRVKDMRLGCLVFLLWHLLKMPGKYQSPK